MTSYWFCPGSSKDQYYQSIQRQWIKLHPDTQLINPGQTPTLRPTNNVIFVSLQNQVLPPHLPPCHLVGVGVPIDSEYHRLSCFQTLAIPTPSLGYQLQSALPKTTIHVIPPLLEDILDNRNFRQNRNQRLSFLEGLLQPSPQRCLVDAKIALTTEETVRQASDFLAEAVAERQFYWIILTTGDDQGLSVYLMNLGLTPTQYCLVRLTEHEMFDITFYRVYLALADLMIYSPSKSIYWKLLLDAQCQNIPVFAKKDLRYDDYILYGGTWSDTNSLRQNLNEFQQMGPGKQLTVVSSVQSLATYTMSLATVIPKLQCLSHLLLLPNQRVVAQEGMALITIDTLVEADDLIIDAIGGDSGNSGLNCNSFGYSSSDGDSSGGDSSGDSSPTNYDSNSNCSSENLIPDRLARKTSQDDVIKHGEPIGNNPDRRLNFQGLHDFLTHDTYQDGQWAVWGETISPNGSTQSKDTTSMCLQFQLEDVDWVWCKQESSVLIKRCPTTRPICRVTDRCRVKNGTI